MRYLITGASGFVGKNLLAILRADRSNEIFAINRSKSFSEGNVHYVISDLAALDFVKDFPLEIDCVIHLAQSLGYRDFPNEAEDMFNVNIRATHQLLEWSRKNNVRTFFFASTANVYKSSTSKLDASSTLLKPNSFYGVSKFSAELMCESYSQFFNVIVGRIFTVFGPNQKGMLVPNMLEKVRKSEKITLAQGKGLLLSPIHVEDLVRQIEYLVSKVKEPFLTINLCGKEQTSLGQIVKKMGAYLALEPKLEITEGECAVISGKLDDRFANWSFKSVLTPENFVIE